jgi:CBS domain-containing protein
VTPDDTLTVADVMVRRPKTLPADVTVAEARTALEYEKVKILLLVDGERFAATISAIPSEAVADEAAVRFADEAPPLVTEDASVEDALEMLDRRPNGRLVVLDEQGTLRGLVCLTSDGREFCGIPTASD